MKRSTRLAGSLAAVLAIGGVGLALSPMHAAGAQTPGAAGAPAAQAKATARSQGPDIGQFMRIRTPGAVTLTADGTMYVRDWPDGVFQIYRVEPEAGGGGGEGGGGGPVAGPGARMTRLTNFKDGASSYSVSPDGKRILLEAAEGGNENDQIYQILPGEIPSASVGGDASALVKPILNTPRVVHSINTWLRNADGFVYTANDASPEDFYIYTWVFSGPTAGTSTRVLAEKGSWGAADVTEDSSRMLVGQFRSASNSSIYELNVSTGTLTDLTPKAVSQGDAAAAQTVSIDAVGYMPGDGAILYTCDIEEGKTRLFMRDLSTGAVRKPIPAFDAFEIDSASINRERTYLTVVTNESGYAVPHVFRLPGFEPVELPAIERGVVFGGVRHDRFMYTVNNARTPGLAYAWEIPAAGQKGGSPRQLSMADDQGIHLATFPLPELVTYKSFDGVEISAFVYMPPGVEAGKPIPFVINYHGGPESQFRPFFDRVSQYLVSQGFGVMQPNVRGSTGYGRAFHMMDDYTKRWDSVRDGVAAAKFLVDRGLATPGKIATWGGSYGGFMAVACLVEDSEAAAREGRAAYFGAGIKQVGIVNLKTFLEQTSGYRRALREAEYGPLSDPEFLLSVSPLMRSEQIKVPMLLQHGLNDPRVPVGEALQLAVALQNRAIAGEPHIEPELLIFPDEGHGIAKLDNRLLFARRMSAFLKRTIGE